MNSKVTDPHFEFRVFGQVFGPVIAPLLASPLNQRKALAGVTLRIQENTVAVPDQGQQTYILAGDQCCSIKMRNHQLDTKVLLRYHQGLERWQPHLQLPFPLTTAFLHEFLFAWLEVEPPPLRRTHYTEAQFVEELIMPHPLLWAVAVHKQRRHFTVNGCQMEITALTINGHDHTHTVAVESADAELLLDTIALLRLHSFTNTNYVVGLRQFVGIDTAPENAWADSEPAFVQQPELATTPELVLVH